MEVFVNDSLMHVVPGFSRTFAFAIFVNGKQFGKKNRFAIIAYYFIAFSECSMHCYK